ncbi:cysteine desulfurase NifS [Candidatus Galacturonibacter soehngenii]|uniref:Cysteine desulfurase IscS n=1 Tax=Candidatus Galacturonatibacter soehngenii TaxID=2307010 RepID=A0A7V7UCH0_9FIRM|nr:cysteine desulfurase NifS [Candidatus Galacturonibacter soehngenii]KAB1439337.1 cysteine desulfurase NifS [Candidatus Galacturonibacter soehngenii]
MNEIIYLDNAATTQLDKAVFEEMQPYFVDYYGNPSSVYSIASESKKAINLARERVSGAIGALDREIYFTNGGTESDNWAIKGIAESYKEKGKHIITSKIEHHAVLHTCEYLEKQGYEITYLNVDEDGLVDLNELEKSIRKDTILITIMFANNEIGTIQPIKEIGEIAKRHDVIFHTDAVQAFGHVPIDVNEMNIDLLSASGHKVNGPKGVGFLYVRKNIKLKAFIHGGAQERQRRAGTENVPGIVGLGAAAKIAYEQLEERTKYLIENRDYLIDQIEKNIDYVRLNGHRTKRLPNNVNFCFRFIEGESLLISLDMEGICASSGSACTSGSLDPSHVLLAIGLPHEIAHGSLRMTLSHSTTKEQLDFVVKQLKDIVNRLRNMSPLYEDFLKNQNK